MPEITSVSGGNLDPLQAKELAIVVELEARWENLRTSAQPVADPPTIQNLHGKQKAYEAFRLKLAAYNKRFAPAHIPELLLNTAIRLGAWSRAMRRLFIQIEHDPQTQCPTQLVIKAYRWANMVARKENKSYLSLTAPPTTMDAAIRDLDVLCNWCDELIKIVPAA